MHASSSTRQADGRSEFAATVLERLRAAYGEPPDRAGTVPIDELVATILSQNTSDTNTDRSFASLRSRFSSWDEVVGAPDREVADAIRSGGLADTKAPRIKRVLSTVRERCDSYDISFLAGLPLDEARSWLTSLPGVGPKTAACVLLFSLGMPAMPVDTHVYRVSRRLGLIPEATQAVAAHVVLESEILPDRMLEAHLLMIEHGRRTCHARRPACERCPLLDLCPAAREFVDVDRLLACA